MASVIVKEENYSDDLLACRICLASDVKLFHIRKWGIDQMFIDLMGTTVSYWLSIFFICLFLSPLNLLFIKCSENPK